MSTVLLLQVLAAMFTAAFLKGITGLGFSTISLGILASFIDIKLAIPLVLVPSLSSNVLVMIEAGGFRATLRRFWPLYLAALPGLLAGLWLLGSVDSRIARTVLGVVLVGYGAWALRNPSLRLAERSARTLRAPVGLVTGFVNGLTGSQVMPVLPYLMALRLSPAGFVQAINVSFTVGSLVMLAGLGRLGLIDAPLLALSATGVVPVALGIFLGGRIRRRLAERVFRTLVLVLLVLLGVNLVVSR